MSTTLRELVYYKDFSDTTKFKLLRIIDSPDWVERLFDLLKELDTGDFERGCCDGCEIKNECQTHEGYCRGTGLEESIIELIRDLRTDAEMEEEPTDELEKLKPEELVERVRRAHDNIVYQANEDKTPGQCTIGGVVCPCDEEKE